MTNEMEHPEAEAEADDADEEIKRRLENQYDRDDVPDEIALEITCVFTSC